MVTNIFSGLASYIYEHPEKFAKHGRLLPKKEALARLKLEGMKMMESGEEVVFESGETLHEVLIHLLKKDLIVVFERNGEIYPCRVTKLIDQHLDELILEGLREG